MMLNILIFFCAKSTSQTSHNKPTVLIESLDLHRVQQIAYLLPDKPKGLGETYKNRVLWDSLCQTHNYKKVFLEADKVLINGMPAYDEVGYMQMFTKGDSQTGKDMLSKRLNALVVLVWAECLENKGKYVKGIHTVLNELISQKTWVNPRNYTEKNFDSLVELSAASYAHNIAQALYLLDDKISPELRRQVIEAIYKRVFNPILKTIETKNKEHFWFLNTNNWNAVCLSGITGAALTLIENREERAKFVSIAERYIDNFLVGFFEDGYCTEGLTYYNFGFSHFLFLRESIWQATKGKIDLLKKQKIQKIAQFGQNSEVINGIYPTIGDCEMNTKPNTWILYYTNKNLGLGYSKYNQLPAHSQINSLVEDILRVFPHSAYLIQDTKTANPKNPNLRYYFEQAGILTVRPLPNSTCKMGAVFQGGNNNEHHNHNDIGSFTIVVGEEILMGDPGRIPYTAKTFGPERYTYKTIASYGHPVPLIAKKEQKEGAEAQAKIIRTDFTDKEDCFEMDITSAYSVSSLKSLVRKFTYNRENEGFLIVKDEFSFSTPQIFESALITRAEWQLTKANEIILKGKKSKLKVLINAPNNSFDVISEQINEEGGTPYTRLGIRLKQPQLTNNVSLIFNAVK